ncbi:MAG: alpha/beta fold hydrolase [Hyphomicrobiaceae bacterium]
MEPSYGKIRRPVLVGWGMDDPWIPIETGRRLHAAIPGAQFHVFNGAGHLVQLEAAPLVASTLMNFLSAENDNAPDFMARANNG